MSSKNAFPAFLILSAVAALPAYPKDPVDYVNPNIGGIGYLLQPTIPYSQMPYGMMRVAPITTPGVTDRYLAEKIYGFPAGGAVLMATTGALETAPANYASEYEHELETVTPYYYAVTLLKYDIEAEYTISERAAYYQFTFPNNAEAHVLFGVRGAGSEVKVSGPASLAGFGDTRGGRHYFYAEFSKPVASSGSWHGPQVLQDRRERAGEGPGVYVNFGAGQAAPIGVRLGVSMISIEQARRNLRREIPEWEFERYKEQARQVWNRALSRIAVEGGTEEQKTIFYTALYRSMGRPHDTSEEDRYYSPADQKVHPAAGRKFYPSSGGLWGSYRSLHPLQLLLDPDRQVDFIRSFIQMFEQSGSMLGIGRKGMIGHHVAALILDTYASGFRDFDLAKAFQGLKHNATQATMIPWRDGPATALDKVYYDQGFFPALARGEKETVPQVDSFERRQAVSVTLEHAYDDWCIAQIAKALGRNDDYEYFMKRAHNYRNVFDQRIGFMAPRSADGKWVDGFDPKLGGGQGGRDYFTEMDGWIYLFYVPHDVAGLANLLGGREKLAAKLDSLFTEQYGTSKFKFLAQFPDQTGLIGLYGHGNEPSFNIPYLYNYAGQPWKTERRVRDIMNIWYNAGPTGISGDEDDGEESSWYVLSAMGFFPVCPGRPIYDIGSPVFSQVRITLSNGKVFTITAKNASGRNKYIQSAQLNGQPLDKAWFERAAVVNGGTLVLEMGPRANKSWASSPDAEGPSMSK